MLAFSNNVGKKILIEKKSFKRLLYGCFPVHWVTASAKYPLFVTSTSTTKSYSNVIFWRLKFSAQKLRIVARSCFWRSQTVRCDWIDLLLMQQTIYSKCCWKSEAVTQQFSVKAKMMFCQLQKQSFADDLQNRCYQKHHKYHRKKPSLEYRFNKVVCLNQFKNVNLRSYFKEAFANMITKRTEKQCK